MDAALINRPLFKHRFAHLGAVSDPWPDGWTERCQPSALAGGEGSEELRAGCSESIEGVCEVFVAVRGSSRVVRVMCTE